MIDEKLKLDYSRKFKTNVHFNLGYLELLEDIEALKYDSYSLIYGLGNLDIDDVRYLMKLSLNTKVDLLYYACTPNRQFVDKR